MLLQDITPAENIMVALELEVGLIYYNALTPLTKLQTIYRQCLSDWGQHVKEKGLEDAVNTWMPPFSRVL
jgi:hypothetical protein